MGERSERLELAWGRSLLEFRPTLNLSTNLWSRVTISAWNRRNRTRPEVAYSLDQLWKDEGLNADLQTLIPLDALGEHDVANVPVHTEDEARDLVRNTPRENFLQLLTADGTTVGQPELRAGSRVEVRGVGTPFSGSYFLTSTTHSIDDNGYRTQFSAKREQVSEGT